MKNVILIAAIALSQVFMSCEKEGEFIDESLELQDEVVSEEVLTEIELNNLLLMREEEKLARDVYASLYEKWNVNVFKNIASSEQQHMDAMLDLIIKYELTDPVGTNEVGIFIDEHLQDLYNQLVSSGSTSLLDGYKVGATIEDLDIYDLDEAVKVSDNEDVNSIYDALNMGSRNHMRAFYAQISALGGTYSAQFIAQEKLDSIINSERETGIN